MQGIDWVVLGFLVGHTVVVLGFGYGVYKVQKRHNNGMRKALEGAIRDVKAKIPDYSAEISAIRTAVNTPVPDYSADISALKQAVEDAKPDYDELEERLGKHLLKVFDGKMSAEVKQITNDPDLGQALANLGAVNPAGGTLAEKFIGKIMDRFGGD